jgi:hypothetical protein
MKSLLYIAGALEMFENTSLTLCFDLEFTCLALFWLMTQQEVHVRDKVMGV